MNRTGAHQLPLFRTILDATTAARRSTTKTLRTMTQHWSGANAAGTSVASWLDAERRSSPDLDAVSAT